MMVLQAFSDVTFTDENGTRLFGPGEILTLPMPDALKAMNLAHEHFKILSPTPIVLGAAVCWSSQRDCVRGPAIVQLIEGCVPNRRIAVEVEGEIFWIAEESVTDVDPWPAIDARLEAMVEYMLIDGDESPKIQEVREWLVTHFDDDVSGR